MKGKTMQDQIPSDGCQVCGKHSGANQWFLRLRLVKVMDEWVCHKCAKSSEWYMDNKLEIT